MGKGKVGIVTWYKNGNFGGTLQAFALMKQLQTLGYEAEFIDYQSSVGFLGKIMRKAKDIIVTIRYPHSAASRNAIWRFVQKEMPQSPRLTTKDSLEQYAQKHLVASVCGSDQIWSSANERTGHYFLDFIEAGRRVAYAPSIGLQELKSEQIAFFAEKVREIPYLSVREENGARLIKEHTGREAQIVVDPSLLLNGDAWRSLAQGQAKLLRDKYILCYFIDYNVEYLQVACALEEHTGLPLRFISTKRIHWGNPSQRLSANPLDFVRLVDEAEYVLTDSFHGLLFSLNLHTPFGVFMRFKEGDPNNQNSRVNHVLSWIDGNQYIVSGETSPNDLLKRAFDWEKVTHILDEKRKNSLNYLSSALNKATQERKKEIKNEKSYARIWHSSRSHQNVSIGEGAENPSQPEDPSLRHRPASGNA